METHTNRIFPVMRTIQIWYLECAKTATFKFRAINQSHSIKLKKNFPTKIAYLVSKLENKSEPSHSPDIRRNITNWIYIVI